MSAAVIVFPGSNCDRDCKVAVERSTGARVEMVERIAVALERRFLLTWCGSADQDGNARPPEAGGPLFGNPDQADPLVANLPIAGTESIDSRKAG